MEQFDYLDLIIIYFIFVGTYYKLFLLLVIKTQPTHSFIIET